jgi:hypothetical protein
MAIGVSALERAAELRTYCACESVWGLSLSKRLPMDAGILCRDGVYGFFASGYCSGSLRRGYGLTASSRHTDDAAGNSNRYSPVLSATTVTWKYL